jgi:hypothetical protein
LRLLRRASYRRVINAIWRPAIGPRRFDPFSIEEAEALIAAIHQDWGDRSRRFNPPLRDEPTPLRYAYGAYTRQCLDP